MGFGKQGARGGFGSAGARGGVNVWLPPLPQGFGYRYWVDSNGNNQLILTQDASGNYFAMYAPLS